MVKFPENYDCNIASQFFDVFTGSEKDAVQNLVEDIKECVKERGLTNEQLGAECWSALQEANRFNQGDE